jgi:DNA-binding transcriptional regulator YdaS (Cro superfamily)
MTTILRKYRETLGKTPSEFASDLGIPEPTLRSLENGCRPITAERALELEQKTRGGVTRLQLRPDLFAELPKRRKAAA